MSKIQDMLSKLVAEGTLTAEQAVELAEAQTARRDNVRVQETGNITVAGVPGLARFGLTSNVVGWVNVLAALGVNVQDTILPSLVDDNLEAIREQQEKFISEGSTAKARENRRKNAEHAFAALGLTLGDS